MSSIPQCRAPFSRTARLLAQPSRGTPRSRPIHTIERCPDPACACAPMPPGLDIERASSMLNAVPSYNKHVMFLTGTADWPSRIEEIPGRPGTNNVVSALKKRLRLDREGNPDPAARVLVSNTSLVPPTSTALLRDRKVASLKELLRDGRKMHRSQDPHLQPTDHVLLAFPTFRYFHARLWREQGQQRLHVSKERSHVKTELLILVCGHASRDARCGVLGPLLATAFRAALERKGIAVSATPTIEVGGLRIDAGPRAPMANVGLVSHVGGHKWAGNVIIYTPPAWRAPGQAWDGRHPLRSTGIWYGRVEPRHVEGIVEETVLKGNVVRELLRGGVDAKGEMIAF